MNLDEMAKAQAFDELCDELLDIANLYTKVEYRAKALRETIALLAMRDCDCEAKDEKSRTAKAHAVMQAQIWAAPVEPLPPEMQRAKERYAAAPVRDETVPPPGWRHPWSHYGCPPKMPEPGLIRDKAERSQYVDIAEAWSIYDREHGHPPAAAAPAEPTGERDVMLGGKASR